jgi:hypothetical protein
MICLSIINHQSEICYQKGGEWAIMSIKFICSCGKHLRARDEMAARRSMCPRCGAPVGIPSMRPTHAGTMAAPLTPQERRRLNRDKQGRNEPDAVETGITSSLALPTRSEAILDKLPQPAPKVRRRRHLEQRWHQCLTYPLLNWKVFFCFAFLLSIFMASLILSFQKLPPFSEATREDWVVWLITAWIFGIIVAYAYATVEWALASALAGQGPASCWPSLRAGPLPLKSALRCLVCFLAGPVFLVALAGLYWLYGGDLKALDGLILAELGVFTVAYWFLSVVSANERDLLRDANPVRVAQLVHRLSYRAVVPVLIAPALMIPHVLVGLFAVNILHQQIFTGWLLLTVCSWSGLFWAAFLFRLLGVWCYRAPLR